jgi:dsRNA-specific ribonuclease
MFMGHGKHKIKKKAEQIACKDAINYLEQIL